MKILAVDDDPIIRDLLATSLPDAGYDDVTLAASAEAALQLINAAQEPFECLLFDIEMPGQSGIALCGEVRAIPGYETAPIIMITASVDPGYIQEAFARGATDYVRKPLVGIELGCRIAMAERLCASLRRERLTSSELAALRETGGREREIDLDAPQSLPDVPGGIDLLALENYFLRLPEGLYRMHIFAHRLPVLITRHAEGAAAYLSAVAEAGHAIARGFEGLNFFQAYVGNGTFVCVLQSQRQIDLSGLHRKVRTQMLKVDCLAQEATFSAELETINPSRLSLYGGASAIAAMQSLVTSSQTGANPQRHAKREPDVVDLMRRLKSFEGRKSPSH